MPKVEHVLDDATKAREVATRRHIRGVFEKLGANNNGKPRLLMNNIGSRTHWLGLRLLGERTGRAESGPSRRVEGRDMYGARVAVFRPNETTLWRRARADGSYGSANDPRVLVGLGDSTEAPKVRVVWPGGRVEEWMAVAIDRYTTLREGSGR